VFGPGAYGYPAEVGAHAKRSLMQVEPARLVELAASSEHVLDAMRHDWAHALDELSGACDALGDAAGTVNLSASYADALADAAEVVTSLVDALELGVAGLVDAVQDAVRADDAVAAELDRTSRALDEGPFGPTPGCGGR
jgi:ABC-type transporter Mla subunit MlaD